MEFKCSCLIIEDEYPAHDVLIALLNDFPFVTTIKNCYNGEEALTELSTNSYDLLFLDVNMPIINGISMLKQLIEKPAIIMTTAYTKYAFEAYENDVLDYLQKPISKERFAKAMEKAIVYIKKRKAEQFKTIELKIDGLKQEIKQENIIYCQSMGNYTKFYFKNEIKPILVNKTLTHHLGILNSEIFIQIHRTSIVNRLFILRKKENILVLENQIEIPIGRKYMHNIKLN